MADKPLIKAILEDIEDESKGEEDSTEEYSVSEAEDEYEDDGVHIKGVPTFKNGIFSYVQERARKGEESD